MSLTRFVTFVVLLAALAAGIVGCGGGGVGGGLTQVQAPPYQQVFSNGHTGVVSDADKMTVESTLDTFWESAVGQPLRAQAMAIVNQMKTMPEFASGGIASDGSAWGQFTDGTELGFCTNDSAIPTTGASSAARPAVPSARERPANLVKPAPRVVQPAARPAKAVSPSDQPLGKQAVIFDAMEPLRQSPTPTIDEELTDQGYTVTEENGSLSDWQNLNGASILINYSHGIPDQNVFWETTSDVPSAAILKQYKVPYDAGQVGFISVWVRDTSPQKGHVEKRMAFKKDWLASFSSPGKIFTPNSLFFNMSCDGSSSLAVPFVRLLQQSFGLCVYAGWSDSVIDADDNESISFFFDRALGLNKVEPINPHNPPPATWVEIKDLMGSTARQDGNPGNMNQSANATLQFANPISISVLTTLIPSISSTSVNYDKETLTLTGDFGSQQGFLLVGGSTFEPQTYAAGTITAQRPTVGGGLQVENGSGLKSNVVQLDPPVQLLPPSTSLGAGEQQLFTATVVDGGQTGRKYTYHWNCTAAYGTMTDASKTHSGSNFDTSDSQVTYKAAADVDPSESDLVSLSVSYVPSNSTTDVTIGKEYSRVSFTAPPIITPTNPTIPQGGQKLFKLTPATGVTYPSNTTYKWSVTGKGSLAGGNPVTTTTPQVNYTAPSTNETETLSVEVINASAAVIDQTSTSITVGAEPGINPSSMVFTTPAASAILYATNAGGLPSDAQYTWTAKNGTFQLNGATAPSKTVTTTGNNNVYYSQPVWPSNGSFGSDTVTLQIRSFTGALLFTATCPVTYGGNPYVTATYPDISYGTTVTSSVGGSAMSNLSSQTVLGTTIWAILGSDGQGGDFFQCTLCESLGAPLTVAQTFSQDFDYGPHQPVPLTFQLLGDLASNTPPWTSGTMKITSSIPNPAGRGTFIGFSFTIKTTGGNITGNGVVLSG